MAAGVSGAVKSNDEETLKQLLDTLPPDHKERIKAAIMAVATPRPDAAPAAEAAAADKPAEAAAAADAPPTNTAPAADATPAAKDDTYGLSEDMLKSVRVAFDAIDTGKEGYIKADEFKTALEALGMKMSEKEVNTVFESFDLNGDRKLQFEEYVNLIKEAMKE